ncbi:MAG: DUF4259 domain-containing protein [Kofleriaceae bacterium]
MGTWGSGPFENDGAADFVTDAMAMPAPTIAQALLAIADAAPDAYLEVDDGEHAVAAAELVALGFGYGKLDDVTANVRRLVRTLGPNEDLRVLALRAMPRLLDAETSELAQLWGEGDDDEFEPAIRDLIERLTEAG